MIHKEMGQWRFFLRYPFNPFSIFFSDRNVKFAFLTHLFTLLSKLPFGLIAFPLVRSIFVCVSVKP